jgi:ribosomal subunit interface protein
MPFRISGKNLDVGDALRTRINARVIEALGKYFDGGYSGHVTIEKEGFGFRTECAVHLDSKITLHAEGMAADAYASADQAAIASRRGCGAIIAASRITNRTASMATRRSTCRAMSSPRRNTKPKTRAASSRPSSSPNRPRC